MKKLKWARFGHKNADPMKLALGELAMFCPACPQAGVNLPDGWLQKALFYFILLPSEQSDMSNFPIKMMAQN